ncbi:hypothetical protein [Rahnella sp. R3(2024)]
MKTCVPWPTAYTHFAPDHLEDAIYLNPLAQMVGEKVAAESPDQ